MRGWQKSGDSVVFSSSRVFETRSPSNACKRDYERIILKKNIEIIKTTNKLNFSK